MADVLFLSAHPDDAEFAAGGTLIKLSKKYEVAHVILTRGEAGTHGTPELRVKEAGNSAKHLGIKHEFMDFKDNDVEDTNDNARKIAEVIRKYKPKIIIAPYHSHNSTHTDGVSHPDHEALGKLAIKAARFAKFKNAPIEGECHKAQRIIYYMVPRYVKPTFIVNVSDIIPELKELWSCHQSQLRLADGKLFEKLLMSRALHGYDHGCEYAEPFIVDDSLSLDIEDFFRI